MKPIPRILLLALTAAIVASSLVPVSGTTGAVPSPRVVVPAPHAFSSVAPEVAPVSAPSATLAPSGSTPATAPAPQTGLCDTPTGNPIWNSNNFFADALVTFSVPGSPQLSGSNFQTVPCPNVIPTYTNGFWMNVTTNVPLVSANVTIWGSSWPTPGNPQPDIPNFSPASPKTLPMLLLPPYYHTARFFFNVYKFFWPGSQVYFNITLSTVSASPGTIRSTQSSHILPVNFTGGVNNATWQFYVQDPWGAGQYQNVDTNFSQAIQVTTSPSVLTTPAYEPNFMQPLQIILTAVNPTGGPVIPLPMAQGTFTLSGGTIGSGVYVENFGPSNHTVMQLPIPLGPYPGAKIQFNVTAWLPWELSTNGLVGAIDRIYSPLFTFNWSDHGGWSQPSEGLGGNVQLTSIPDVTSSTTSSAVLSTGTPVNLTIHSPIENITISSGSVGFHYSDANGASTGTITMGRVNANTSYAVLPGLPPNSQMTFSITAKDVFQNPVSSGNYTYTESGPTASALPAGYGLFFAEGVDLTTGLLIPHVNYTIGNDTWSEKGVGNIYGFLGPVPLGGVGYLPVAFGSYTVTIGVFGVQSTYSFTVGTSDPFTVLFYFTSKPVTPTTTVAQPAPVTLPAIVGLAGATIASVPIVNWFRERRRKAEAEQRRITL